MQRIIGKSKQLNIQWITRYQMLPETAEPLEKMEKRGDGAEHLQA